MSPTAQKVYAFVRDFTLTHGRAPQHKEIAHALGHASAGSVSRALTQLRRAGLLQRGIVSVARPTSCPNCGHCLAPPVEPLQ